MSPRERSCLGALASLVIGFALLIAGIGAGFTALMHPNVWRATLPAGFGETWTGVAAAMALVPAGVWILRLNPYEGADEKALEAARTASPSPWIGLFSGVGFSAFGSFLLTSSIWVVAFPSGDGESMSWEAVRAAEPGWNVAGALFWGLPIGVFILCFVLFVFLRPTPDHQALVGLPKRALDRRAAAKYERALRNFDRLEQAGRVTLAGEGRRGGVSATKETQ